MKTARTEKRGNAFIGVSLDTKLFSRAWVRYAMNFILHKHHSLLFLLADDLLRYTRTVQVVSGKTILNIPEISDVVNSRRLEFEKFLTSEIKRLNNNFQSRILIKPWHSFTDNSYVQILRYLHIAYATLIPFQQCVNDVAVEHINKSFGKLQFPDPLQTSVAFLLDEVAMCLRITELDQFPYEYYPENQTDILTQLYENRFFLNGLSAESLTGKLKISRQFQILKGRGTGMGSDQSM